MHAFIIQTKKVARPRTNTSVKTRSFPFLHDYLHVMGRPNLEKPSSKKKRKTGKNPPWWSALAILTESTCFVRTVFYVRRGKSR